MNRSLDFQVQVKQILDDYSKDVEDAVIEACGKVADDTAKRLKDLSPKRGKGSDSYSAGWRRKKLNAKTFVVYNATKPGLTHLLENGHMVKPFPTHPGKKVRVEGIKHISTAEDWAASELDSKVEEAINKA